MFHATLLENACVENFNFQQNFDFPSVNKYFQWLLNFHLKMNLQMKKSPRIYIILSTYLWQIKRHNKSEQSYVSWQWKLVRKPVLNVTECKMTLTRVLRECYGKYSKLVAQLFNVEMLIVNNEEIRTWEPSALPLCSKSRSKARKTFN